MLWPPMLVRRMTVLLLVVCGVSAGVALRAAQAEVAASRFDGKPQLKEGVSTGYFVWREGPTWRVRWTSAGDARAFSGHLHVTGGALLSFARVDGDDDPRAGSRRRRPRPGRPARGRVRTTDAARGFDPDEDDIRRESDTAIRWSAVGEHGEVMGFDFTVDRRADRITFHFETDGRVQIPIEVGTRNLRIGDLPLVAILH